MLTRSDPSVGNPVHELAGDRLGIGMAISLLLRQDMPNSDQQFTGNGDNRLLFTDPPAQALKLGFPMGMMLHRDPGSFDHHTTQITSAFFGDMSPLMSIPRVMHA